MKILESLPEFIIILLSLITILVCIFSWITVREYAALGYLLACLYLFVTYTIFKLFNIPDEQRRFWARLGYIIFLSNIIIWRANFYIRQRKHGKN